MNSHQYLCIMIYIIYINNVNLYTSDIGVPVGQNYAWDGDYQNVNWANMVNLWHSENQYFVFGSGSNTTGEDIGHYTQVGIAMFCKILGQEIQSVILL